MIIRKYSITKDIVFHGIVYKTIKSINSYKKFYVMIILIHKVLIGSYSNFIILNKNMLNNLFKNQN